MNLKKSEWILVLFNLAYLIGFSWFYFQQNNWEFLLYIGVIVVFFILIAATIRKSKFNNFILWGLSIWGLLHMLGGGLMIGDHVLYKQMIYPFIMSGEMSILKFDQLVHIYGFFITTLVGYYLLLPYLTEKTNWKVVYFLLVMVGMGFGALNEVAEFVATVIMPESGVGGYVNTSLDLVSNMIGSILGVLFIHFGLRGREK
jgi:uncharacterized membrane protein YjdF